MTTDAVPNQNQEIRVLMGHQQGQRPSLTLLGPTIREWSIQCSTQFLYTVSEDPNGGIYDEQNRRNVRERLII